MSSVAEVWKPVVGHETTHMVSNLGRVKALPFEMRHWCGKMIPQPERILKPVSHSGGYRTIAFRGKNQSYIHRVVMEAFVGPGKGMDVNHIDGDKTNNALSNLEYCDRKHNVHHAIRTGLQNNAGEGNGMHRYFESQMRHVLSLRGSGLNHKQIAARTGVSIGMVQQVLRGVRWKHVQEAVA